MEKNLNSTVNEEEIDIKDIILPIWKNKIKIATFGLLISLITLIFNIFFINDYYSTNVKLLPESDSKSGMGGNLNGLAGLAGINLNDISSSEAYRPDLYPEIINSIHFKKELLNKVFYFSDIDKNLKLKDYLPLKYRFRKKNPLAIDLKKISKKAENLQIMDWEDYKKLDKLNEIISSDMDEKTGIITINVSLTDPIAAAEIANYSKDYLIKYIQNYKTGKQRKELSYLTKELNKAESEYLTSLKLLSLYKDGNLGIYSNYALNQEKKLEDEMNLKYNLFTTLSTQKSQAEIKLAKANPVIQVLGDAHVPNEKAGPKKAINTILGGIVGLILASGFYLLKYNGFFNFLKELN